MSYQTLPTVFHFHPFLSSSKPLFSSSFQVKEMELAALKSSFLRPEMAVVKPAQPLLGDESWVCGNGEGDELFVDELLDFSNEDVKGFIRGEEKEEEEEEKGFCGSLRETVEENSNSSVSVKEEFGSELGIPTDDLADLEWLSHFVDDSFTEFPSLPYHKDNPNQNINQKNSSHNETMNCTKLRSKRSRTGGRVWSFSDPAVHESSPSSSSSSSPSCLIFTNTGQNPDPFYFLGNPPKKSKPNKEKKKARPLNLNAQTQTQTQIQTQTQRRCTHCLVQKTPQWRTGPLGPKTLCNACGVRYKSGRLLPEYRPAGSPTFMSDVHSNSHRKVLDIRRNKEVVEPDPGLRPVQHFEV
ncbi:GATA transcription factor 4-like [Tasmannia lanceolata]|uniref:GATA transcription factor 4-like n=1 Tax=Tasmannia lanceolata TaxID=3420 RepID=UPI0040649884